MERGVIGSSKHRCEPFPELVKLIWLRLMLHAGIAVEHELCACRLQLGRAPLTILIPHLQATASGYNQEGTRCGSGPSSSSNIGLRG